MVIGEFYQQSSSRLEEHVFHHQKRKGRGTRLFQRQTNQDPVGSVAKSDFSLDPENSEQKRKNDLRKKMKVSRPIKTGN